jgi:hypothetical protein
MGAWGEKRDHQRKQNSDAVHGPILPNRGAGALTGSAQVLEKTRCLGVVHGSTTYRLYKNSVLGLF